MKVKTLVEGHAFELENFENKETPGQVLQFIHKQPLPTDPTLLETVKDGTTNEIVIEALLIRLKFLNNKFPCKENKKAIKHLKKSLNWLEKRTKNREKRNVEGKNIK